MKEVKKCSISGVAFTMDADAYQELENYLDSLKKTYKDTPDGAEIVADIEARIAELILTTQDNTRVVEKPLILNIIHQMGSVEDISEESSDKKAPEEPRIPRRRYRDTVLDVRRHVDFIGEEVDDERAQEIRKFLSGLLQQMEVQAEVKVYLPEKGRYKVFLEGQGLGAIIGRRGETLDAIQQLTSYSVNRTGSRVRVQLDAENYRAKREQSLERLANKVAGKVVKYRRSVTLEPMNAYERHVIHTALQKVPGVTTYSTGVDPNRRVIVAYDREKK